jgi:hypothetical protein
MFYNHVYVYCIVILIHKVVFENLTLGSFTLGRYISISAARRRRKSEVTTPFKSFDHGSLFGFNTHYMCKMHRFKDIANFLIVDYGGMSILTATGRL